MPCAQLRVVSREQFACLLLRDWGTERTVEARRVHNSPPSTSPVSRFSILNCMRSRSIAPKKNPSLRRFPAVLFFYQNDLRSASTKSVPPASFRSPDTDLPHVSPGSWRVLRLRGWLPGERSDRSQPLNGSVARLRRPQAGTNVRGAKWSQGCQGAITARSVRWFRRVLIAELHIKRLIPDRLGDSIIKSLPPQLPEIRSKRQNNWRSKTGPLWRYREAF
jgi:hypothetical protein